MFVKKKLFLISMLLLGCLGCTRQNPRILPAELVGHWTTNDPSYQGRFLELSKTFVIIGAGDEVSPDVQTIERVESQIGGGGTEYTIYSTTRDGVHDQISLQFSPLNGGEIRLSNRANVLWKRTKSTDSDTSSAAQ